MIRNGQCWLLSPSSTGRQGPLAILVDGGGDTSILERFHTRPGILRAFGWQVAVVMTKDWWHEPEAVLERIERLLRKEIEEVVIEPEASVEVASESAAAEHVIAAAEQQETDLPVELVAQQVHEVRCFELTDGKSSKFWSAGQEGSSLVIRFGRIGTNGQVQRKDFLDDARANREIEKLIREKIAKGYVEVG